MTTEHKPHSELVAEALVMAREMQDLDERGLNLSTYERGTYPAILGLVEQLEAAHAALLDMQRQRDLGEEMLRDFQAELEVLRSVAEDSLSILDSLKGGLAFSRGEVIARLREALASSPAMRRDADG